MSEILNERYIVALEIGSSKIRGAIGTVDGSGIVDIVATEEEAVSDKVRYGQIQNVEIANQISNVVSRLQNHTRIAPRTIQGVYVGLGGRSIRSEAVEVAKTMPCEAEITPEVMNEMTMKASACVPEDRDVVDIIPRRFVVDGKTMNNPISSYGRNIQAKMTVVSCAPQNKRMIKRVLNERLGLRINDFVTTPLAEARMVLTEEERNLGCMFVDFGAQTTSVVIYRNRVPVYVTVLPMGSRNITLDITKLNHIEERAEEIKKYNGNAMAPDNATHRIDGIDYTEINNYIHARAEEICANIVAQIEYAGLKSVADLPKGIVIVGRGARLRGFNDLLARQSKMQVRQGTPTTSVRIFDGSIDAVDAIDVISILSASAALAPAECLSPAPVEEPKTAPQNYEELYSEDEEAADKFSDNETKDVEEEEEHEATSIDRKVSVLQRLRERIAGMTRDES